MSAQSLRCHIVSTCVSFVPQIVGDAVGWGFVVRGSKPCHIQAVDPGGPAAAAGMKVRTGETCGGLPPSLYLLWEKCLDVKNVWSCSCSSSQLINFTDILECLKRVLAGLEEEKRVDVAVRSLNELIVA